MKTMTTKRALLSKLIFCVFLTFGGLVAAQAADPLPSWKDGKAKQSIIEFVAKVTKQGSSDFVPADERIATFDIDEDITALP